MRTRTAGKLLKGFADSRPVFRDKGVCVSARDDLEQLMQGRHIRERLQGIGVDGASTLRDLFRRARLTAAEQEGLLRELLELKKADLGCARYVRVQRRRKGGGEVHYFFDSSSRGWKEERKHRLADRLAELVGHAGYEPWSHPYVEVDWPSPGVFIRRITHVSEDEVSKLVEQADAIYKEVMLSTEQPGRGRPSR